MHAYSQDLPGRHQLIKNDLGEISNIVVTDRLLYSSLSYEFRNQKLNFYMHVSTKPLDKCRGLL